MPAGIIYETDAFQVERELYAVESGYRCKGGFNLVTDGLTGQTHVPVLCPIRIDHGQRKAYVVKNVKVVEAVASDATTVKIQKGSFAKVGMILMLAAGVFATISAIDTSEDAYDELTISAAFGVAVPNGSVLTEAVMEKRVAKVVADAAAAATSVKIAKGSGITGACTLSDGTNDITVSAVDMSRSDYDTLTVSALAAKLDTGAEISDKTATYAKAVRSANALNYARTKIEAGATVTALYAAMEIKESQLYIPVTEADKASLTSRFMFE